MRTLETYRKLVSLRLFTLATLALLLGCVTVQPPVLPRSTPQPDTAYLAGLFARNAGDNYGFAFVNTQTQVEYIMSFGKQGVALRATESDLSLIAVPPGEYRIERWLTFGNIDSSHTAQPVLQKPVASTNRLATPFKVEAGQIVHLGSFIARTEFAGKTRYWNIDPVPITYPDAAASVAKGYPGFANQLVICLFCDPATGPQQPGLGTYDPKRLFEGIGEGRKATAAMKAFFAPRDAQVAPVQESIEKLQDAYMAETRQAYKTGIGKQIEMKRANLTELIARLTKEIDVERERVSRPIWDHLKALAEELRVETKLAKVVSKNAEVWTGVDLTDELVKRYEARWPAPDAPSLAELTAKPEVKAPGGAPAAVPAPASAPSPAAAPVNAAPAP